MKTNFLPWAKSRNTDPSTSKAAAKKTERSGNATCQRNQCLNFVINHPGCTSAEIANRLGMDRYTPSRRLPELRDSGYVMTGTTRLCHINGNVCMTWWPVDDVIREVKA